MPAVKNYTLVEDSFISFVSTLDDLGNRITVSDEGFEDPRGHALNIFHKIDESEFYLLDTVQAKCMHIKAGAGGQGEIWSNEGCSKSSSKGESGSSWAWVECTCDPLKDYYFALVKDLNEKLFCPGDPRCGPEKPRRKAPADREKSWMIMLLILIPLGFMGICLPLILKKLDRLDIERLEKDKVEFN